MTPAVSDVHDEQSLLVSYLTLRRIVGGLGIGLPIVLGGAGEIFYRHLQPSISAYYDLEHTRDLLVGALFAIGFFLLTYRGYEREDDIAGYLCFGFALCVALCRHDGPEVTSTLHFAAAAGLFLTLAYYSFFLFTKTSGEMTPEKKSRNKIYRGCGAAIVVCLVIIAVHSTYALVTGAEAKAWRPLFWLESTMLWAFGWSWMIKGETLWRDAGLPPGVKPAERRSVTSSPTFR